VVEKFDLFSKSEQSIDGRFATDAKELHRRV
jgi:hypothetical protein